MLQIRNNSVLTTPITLTATATQIPFDTIDINSNNRLAFTNNKVLLKTVGIYDTEVIVNLSNTTSADVAATLQLYAEGEAIAGSLIKITVPASCSITTTLPWTVKVINSADGIANISWYVSGAGVTIDNVIGRVSALM